MSSPDQGTTTGLDALSREALAEAERALGGGSIADVSDEAVQRLLLAAVRLFSAKRDAGDRLEAFPPNSVTATDVAVTCVAMTEAVNLELFELALWHGWSNI
ncbi:MAG TPA: hypothetical protein VFS32_10490 [Candidatus Limnocylindrales bacterium]|nr:hypothetical protein [Candidatus Limnocylindrales bacterium]